MWCFFDRFGTYSCLYVWWVIAKSILHTVYVKKAYSFWPGFLYDYNFFYIDYYVLYPSQSITNFLIIDTKMLIQVFKVCCYFRYFCPIVMVVMVSDHWWESCFQGRQRGYYRNESLACNNLSLDVSSKTPSPSLISLLSSLPLSSNSIEPSQYSRMQLCTLFYCAKTITNQS